MAWNVLSTMRRSPSSCKRSRYSLFITKQGSGYLDPCAKIPWMLPLPSKSLPKKTPITARAMLYPPHHRFGPSAVYRHSRSERSGSRCPFMTLVRQGWCEWITSTFKLRTPYFCARRMGRIFILDMSSVRKSFLAYFQLNPKKSSNVFCLRYTGHATEVSYAAH